MQSEEAAEDGNLPPVETGLPAAAEDGEQKPASERPSAEAVKKDSASKDGKAKLKENPAELDESKVEKASEKAMSVKEGGERVEMPADLADQSTDKKETEISADAQVDAQTATKADHMQKSPSRR